MREPLDRMFAARDPKLAHAQFAKYHAALNSGDGGAFAERWCARYAKDFEGQEWTAKPGLDPAQNPAAVRPDGKAITAREPDYLEGSTAVEVKSTTQGLSSRDIEQNEDVLAAVSQDQGAQMTVGGKPFTVRKLRIAFTSAEGAAGSARQLDKWLEAFPKEFELVVFAPTPVRVSDGTLAALNAKYGSSSLQELLDALARESR